MKKSIRTKLLTFVTVITMGVAIQASLVVAANAKFTATTKATSDISVKSVDYDYDDYDDSIDIDFSTRIKLKSTAKATVKDDSGNTYKTYIEESDSNEIDLDIVDLKAGKSYTVTISGIKKATASKYGTLTIEFSIPKASTNIVEDIDFDYEDDEVTFNFTDIVKYKNPKVTITNESGTKTYKVTIIEKESDELSVRVVGLKEGNTYKYSITGVTNRTIGSPKTLTGSFVALDD